MKKKSTLVCFAAVAALCAASPEAKAGTVAWWHFDEAAPGTTAAPNTVADAVAGVVAVPEISESTTVYAAGTEQYANSAFAPAYDHPLLGLSVFDPVSAVTNANRSALRFTTANGGASNFPAYYGGCLKVANTQSLLADCASAITVEAFICTTGGLNCANTFAPIFASVDGTSWTGECWALYLDTEEKGLGGLAMRINTGTGVVRYQNNATSVKINDGFWHHVAYVYDGTAETPNVKLYIDYNLAKTITDTNIKSSIPYGSNNAVYIGGYDKYLNSGNGYRRFPGLIDEVRISNDALTPEQFLRLVTGDNDPDVVLHLNFNTADGGEPKAGDVVGGTIGGIQGVFNTVAGTGTSSYDTSVKAGNVMAEGPFADSSMADTASFCQMTNGAGKANFIKVANTTGALFPDGATGLTNLTFTLEAFFKTSTTNQGVIRQTVAKMGSNYLVAHFITGDAAHPHQMEMCFNDYGSPGSTKSTWTNIRTPASTPVDDGEWHHVAIVSDADARTVRGYLDYQLVDTKTGIYAPIASSYSLFVGSKENGENQFFDGWIDDVRLTKRVLKPQEFLTSHPVGSGTKPVLTAMLEQDYEFACPVDGYWTVAGTGSARTGGAAPVFEQKSRGTLLLDGTNGSVKAENAWSAKMSGGTITFPSSPLYEFDAYTVEFWAKFDGFKDTAGNEYEADHLFDGNSQHVGILRFVQGETTTYDWYLYRQARNAKSFQIAVRQADNSVVYKTFMLDRTVADGKWHHYAVEFSRNADNTSASILLYADCKPLASGTAGAEAVPQTFNGIYTGAAYHRLMVCESSGDNYPGIIGNIDAIRFWSGNPDPAQFMGRVRYGTTVLIR